MTSGNKVRVAIIGIGNCACALIQGLEFYKSAAEDAEIPGLMHASIGGYHVRDIEISAAFDVIIGKVGVDVSEAIWAEPNNTIKFSDVPNKGVIVHRGMTHDGIGKYLQQKVTKAEGPTDDIIGILKDTKTDVVINFMPVGSEMATKWYVEQSLEAGCAFVNGIPVFIASSPYWSKRFEDKNLPIIGDDRKQENFKNTSCYQPITL
jgi:myo-inositol-1-phosphate synthase